MFDIAKAHEDYIIRYELYEGTGNEDPGYGTRVLWEDIPHLKIERSRPGKGVRQLPETKVDEDAVSLNSTRASFDSTSSNTEDVKMPPDDISNHPSPYGTSNQTEDVKMPPDDISNNPSLYGTSNHTEDVKMPPYDISNHPLPYSTSNYTEDVGMPLYDISNDPSLSLEQTLSQPYHQTPPQIEEENLQGTGLIPYYSELAFSGMAGAPYPAGSNSFTGYGPVVPHNIAAVSTLCWCPSCTLVNAATMPQHNKYRQTSGGRDTD